MKRFLALSGFWALAFALIIAYANAQTSAPVASQPFSVQLNAQDGQNINQICTFAMDNGALNISTRTSVGQFCLDLLNRIGKAQQAGTSNAPATSGAPAAPAEEKK